jgi:hypothetical protein
MLRKNLTSCRRLVVDNFRQGALFLWKYVEFLSSVIQKETVTIFRNSYFIRKYPISGVSKKTLFFLLNPIIKLYVCPVILLYKFMISANFVQIMASEIWCEKWFEEDGNEELDTEGAREEPMERDNWASQNSKRVVELKKKEEKHPKCTELTIYS